MIQVEFLHNQHLKYHELLAAAAGFPLQLAIVKLLLHQIRETPQLLFFLAVVRVLAWGVKVLLSLLV